MKTQKMSLANAKGGLSRKEMKTIMAGSGSGGEGGFTCICGDGSTRTAYSISMCMCYCNLAGC